MIEIPDGAELNIGGQIKYIATNCATSDLRLSAIMVVFRRNIVQVLANGHKWSF